MITENKKPASKCKFLSQWQEEFTRVVFDKDHNIMTCKICIRLPYVQEETLQKHNIGGHLHACDASLAKQKPMENWPIAQGLRRGGMVLEEQNRKELVSQSQSQSEHYLSIRERRTALH